MRGLYIHLPFCRRKCRYCDFYSLAGRDELIGPYLGALRTEARRAAPRLPAPETLYIGGGTPSLLNTEQLGTLFSVIETVFRGINRFMESTFEANPESLTPAKIAVLRTAGISRVSLGLQAAQNRVLNRLGRLASFEDFLRVFKALRDAGFGNINVDLMTGLPGQDPGDFRETLEKVLALEPEHISFYPLEVRAGTPFHSEGVREEPDAAAEMFESALTALENAGFRHYEISNFARPGMESLHNLNYWEQGDYIGLGAAAASHYAGNRWTNTEDTERYIRTAAGDGGPEKAFSETLAPEQRKAERVLLGLRKTEGIELPEDIFIEFSGKIAGLAARDLLEVSGRRVKIKRGRLYLSNEVFREFV